MDFDGVVPAGRGAELWVRWHALQTKRVSDIFRRVFGDGAMGNRVRILYEYQYDNYQATASEGLLFLERYFDNADGEQHVPDPRPVSAYLWGAGAATYYGSANPIGAVAGIVVPDGGFEKPKETSSWKFQGESGVYRTPALADGIRLRDAGRASPSPGVTLGFAFPSESARWPCTSSAASPGRTTNRATRLPSCAPPTERSSRRWRSRRATGRTDEPPSPGSLTPRSSRRAAATSC